MGEIEPHMVFPPLIIVETRMQALSIKIEYLEEYLTGEMIDRP
jgi:hypothetical protein